MAKNPEQSRRVHVQDNVQVSKNIPTDIDRRLNRRLISLSMLLGVLSFGVISAVIAGMGLFPSLFLNSNKITSTNQEGNISESSARNVLGDATKLKKLTGELFINIPTILNDKLTVNADTLLNGNATVSGNLTAPNITYRVLAGENIKISGDPQNPKISTGPIVTSLAGKTGELKLAGGTGVTINGLEIGLTSDQVTVTAGNGLSGGGPVKLGGSISLVNDGVVSLTGTANQIVVSASKGDVSVSLSPNAQTTSLTLTGLTEGSVLFAGPGGLISQDNTNFFFNNTTNMFGIGTSAPTKSLHVVGTSLITEVATFTHIPTLAHLSPWPSGTSNGADASIYINPASSVADGNLLVAAVNGTAKFIVDAEGDIYGNNLILTGTVDQGSTTVTGDLTVTGNTILGDAPTDTITLNGRVNSNIIPSVDNT